MDFPSLESVLGLEWLGTWVPEHIYNTNQVVDFEANIYVCTTKNINIPPTNTEAWNLYKDHPISRMLSADVISQLPVNIASDNPILVTQPVAFVPPPPLSEWTWINQGPYDYPDEFPLLVTAEDIPGGIRFQVPGPTNWQSLIVANDPLPDPPYTITGFFRTGAMPFGSFFGLSIRNSESGNTFSWYLTNEEYSSYLLFENNIMTESEFGYLDSDNSSASIVALTEWYFRIQNDGSNVRVYLSADGVSFTEYLVTDVSEAGSFDQLGIYEWNYSFAYSSGDPPYLEAYQERRATGRFIFDLLSLEIIPEIVDPTVFI